jgi:hypothetical protein
VLKILIPLSLFIVVGGIPIPRPQAFPAHLDKNYPEMSTAHDDWPPSPISSTSLSPASTANFTDSATLEFVNVTKEEAMTGLTSVRADKAHSDDKTSERRRVAHNDVERQRRGDLNRRILVSAWRPVPL